MTAASLLEMGLMPIAAPRGCDAEFWMLNLDAPALAANATHCSQAEQLTAARFHQPRHRQRYLMGRHALRVALAAHCGQAAPDLRIGTNAFGKPCLVDWPKLQFNISHSEQRAIIGISHVASIGVDIEMARANCSNADVVMAHFTTDEAAAWHQARPTERDLVFLTVWTRKEACLKAWGVGLSLAPRDVRVGLGAGEQPLHIRLEQACGGIRLWNLRPTADSVAAVALCHDAQAGAG